MAIKPILFNTEMVRAILDGRKTCTRRVIKLLKNMDGVPVGKIGDSNNPLGFMYPGCIKRPPYQPGDILYVRETWGYPIALNSDEQYVFRADEVAESGFKNDSHIWYPSIHMPKEAARIWLRVTNVRVERLKKCGEGWCLDIEKEGITTPQSPILYVSDDKYHDALRVEFQKLWNSTIKKSDLDRYGWDANPYVFVIEFERCEKPEGVQ